MWGSNLPIGTHMMDPKTLNIYIWNGKIWSKELQQSKTLDIVYACSTQKVIEHESPPNFIASFKKIKVKTKKPCPYNIFIKDMILSKKFDHLSCQERMRAIAKKWKTRES